MKNIAISTALALLTSMVAAAPTPASASIFPIKFIGAADGQFTQSFTAGGRVIDITNPLSISKIYNPSGFTCFIFGVHGSNTVVPAGRIVDVGPPQTQDYGFCN
ncbi:MAG: hypothetical protein Q9226_004768 [Calogaya cf. arnoldii]